MSGRLYVGIDLGTFQSTIASSAGAMHSVETVVGRPKDPVARNFLKRDVLFGADALKNKLACNLYRPMAAGVAQDDEANLAAAKAFVSHLIETVDPEEFDEVFGVICSPSHVSFTDKSNLVATLRGQVNAIMVVTEPFATAFAIGEIGGSIVVDIGAGTTDIARIHGTFPTDEDQVTIQEAGDWLDLELKNLIAKKFTGAQITKDMARRWKEQYSFVSTSTPDEPIMVDFSIEGKAMTLDITDCVQAACESIVEPIVDNVKALIAGSNPEFHDEFRRNMVLAGGGSGIRGLGALIERRLSDMGEVNVHVVDDPVRLGAMGGLRLAMEVPEDMSKNLTLASR